MNDDADAGELRWHRRWVLYVTVDYSIEELNKSDNSTYIGETDVEATLITGCALKHNTPTKPFLERRYFPTESSRDALNRDFVSQNRSR